MACTLSLGLIRRSALHSPALHRCLVCPLLIKSDNKISKRLSSSNHSIEYGKYYKPSTWEEMYQWFADTALVKGMENGLIAVHDTVGLPWWATIALCTVALRASMTTPLFVWQMKKMFRYKMLIPTLEEISLRLTSEADEAAKKYNWDERTRALKIYTSYLKHQKQLFTQHKIPGTLRRYMLPWIQIPIWFSMTAALRCMTLTLPYMAAYSSTGIETAFALSQEGALWFSNLCTVDTYYILPVLLGLCNLAVIEVHRGDGKTPMVPLQRVIVNTLRCLSLLLIPVACHMPSGVVLYWLTSSSYGLAQALAFQSVRFKKLLRLPIPIDHSKTPYRDILSRFNPKSITKT